VIRKAAVFTAVAVLGMQALPAHSREIMQLYGDKDCFGTSPCPYSPTSTLSPSFSATADVVTDPSDPYLTDLPGTGPGAPANLFYYAGQTATVSLSSLGLAPTERISSLTISMYAFTTGNFIIDLELGGSSLGRIPSGNGLRGSAYGLNPPSGPVSFVVPTELLAGVESLDRVVLTFQAGSYPDQYGAADYLLLDYIEADAATVPEPVQASMMFFGFALIAAARNRPRTRA
jgi:hypothetical protein